MKMELGQLLVQPTVNILTHLTFNVLLTLYLAPLFLTLETNLSLL